MRILELRFKNLNSLQGEWKIDFTHPDYQNNGIFALTGPTGSGKSTILDAICLALYGETPRLGKITKSDNEIMSRHTGECYAEVVFESQAGTYRCHWEQRRARKSSEGNLQDQEHQIAEAYTGKLIESKKSRVVSVIEDKTGMDFKRFNRSILLAQGSFDSFLKAEVSHKSEILEQITGTEIYSEISKQVHERRRMEEQALTLLQAEVKGIPLLSEQDILEIQRMLTEQKSICSEREIMLNQTRTAVEWLMKIHALQQSLKGLEHEKIKLLEQQTAFQVDKERLQHNERARHLETVYASLIAVRQQLATVEKDWQQQQQRLPSALAERAQAQLTVAAAQQEWQRLRNVHKEQAVIWQSVKQLDYELNDQNKALVNLTESNQRLKRDINALNERLTMGQATYANVEQQRTLSEHYVMEHRADEWLVAHFFALETQLDQLKSLSSALSNQEQTQQRLNAQSETLTQSIQRMQDELDSLMSEKNTISVAHQIAQQNREALLNGRTLADYRREKESLLKEQLLISRIASLEEERKRLQQGIECPLCGSKDHPFVEHSVPEMGAVEEALVALTNLMDKIEQCDVHINAYEHKLSEVNYQCSLKQSEISQLAEKLTEMQSQYAQITQERAMMQQQYNVLNQRVQESLTPLKISDEYRDDGLIEHLKERLEAWQAQEKTLRSIQEQLAEIKLENQQLLMQIDEKNAQWSVKDNERQLLTQAYEEKYQQRRSLFADKDVAEEERQFGLTIDTAEQHAQQAQQLHQQALQQVHTLEQLIQTLQASHLDLQSQLSSINVEFSNGLIEQEFASESEFLAARLSMGEYEALSKLAKDLEQLEMDLKAREKDRTEQLQHERAKALTNESLDDLQARLMEHEAELATLREGIMQLEFQLGAHEQSLERIQGKQAEIDRQSNEYQRWDKLHGLIGSADGKKFRNFAQGLTFEIMINHANRQLMKMTDRYLLIRDLTEPLKLNVVDNYQAGEVRSTKNLSGGESFIISLALALGLSKMASQNVRVDSLFLDEGFGTLDEEALDTALSVLSNLHGEGKLIGIISHVSALKERIHTQIQIQPLSGGRSEIIGPGCQRIV